MTALHPFVERLVATISVIDQEPRLDDAELARAEANLKQLFSDEPSVFEDLAVIASRLEQEGLRVAARQLQQLAMIGFRESDSVPPHTPTRAPAPTRTVNALTPPGWRSKGEERIELEQLRRAVRKRDFPLLIHLLKETARKHLQPSALGILRGATPPITVAELVYRDAASAPRLVAELVGYCTREEKESLIRAIAELPRKIADECLSATLCLSPRTRAELLDFCAATGIEPQRLAALC